METSVSAPPPGQKTMRSIPASSAIAIARRIAMPQALPLLLPTMTGLMIGLFKDSALLSVISVHEFMFAAKGVVSDTYAPLEVYGVVALVYWAATASLHFVTRRWERRLARAQQIAPAR